ncbi:MAG: hypothetical protein HYV07_12190 [Deltaproteobacteria bacterium]|nr:hypothetical protein [Deltaproteobacteria bacterium]
MTKRVSLARERRIRELVRGLGDALARLPTNKQDAAHAALETNMAEDVPLSLRVPAEVLARSEALVPALEAVPEFRAGRVSRAWVIRLAMLRGLDSLELEYGTPNAPNAEMNSAAKPKRTSKKSKQT